SSLPRRRSALTSSFPMPRPRHREATPTSFTKSWGGLSGWTYTMPLAMPTTMPASSATVSTFDGLARNAPTSSARTGLAKTSSSTRSRSDALVGSINRTSQAAVTRGAWVASRGPSVDLLRVLAQLPAQDLADIGLRQFGPELHQPRDLVGRESRPAVGD